MALFSLGVKRDWSSEAGSAHCSPTQLARSAASSEAAESWDAHFV